MNTLHAKSRQTAYPLKAKVEKEVGNSGPLKMATMTFHPYWTFLWEVMDRDHMILTTTQDTQHALAIQLDHHQAFQVRKDILFLV